MQLSDLCYFCRTGLRAARVVLVDDLVPWWWTLIYCISAFKKEAQQKKMLWASSPNEIVSTVMLHTHSVWDSSSICICSSSAVETKIYPVNSTSATCCAPSGQIWNRKLISLHTQIPTPQGFMVRGMWFCRRMVQCSSCTKHGVIIRKGRLSMNAHIGSFITMSLSHCSASYSSRVQGCEFLFANSVVEWWL